MYVDKMRVSLNFASGKFAQVKLPTQLATIVIIPKINSTNLRANDMNGTTTQIGTSARVITNTNSNIGTKTRLIKSENKLKLWE